ncbi:metallophosphoesterase [Acetobacter sp. AN02]|uniref:metallophosphoesterase family protein n=1 Tax=Acetobacter sp. AN02 TaxID=2894186 RepID=UPI0024343991|nr:metallophosphoesterase [Acetobacter sp. AN02]MDG6094251.1 metallophosphoesterase [Acetobacter sp. AN02]
MSVTLAHLSDLHLPFGLSPGLRDLAGKRLLSFFSWTLRRRHVLVWRSLSAVMKDIYAAHPDVLAIAGDMTNLGLPDELRRARTWLAELGLPRMVIPGNHDAMVPMDWKTGPGQWAPEGGMITPHDPLVCHLKDDVTLIGLNSAVPTPPFCAWGRIGASQASALEAMLKQLGEEGRCRVVMIHHPPHPDLVVNRKALRDWRLCAEVLQSGGAELVLHGHSHRGTISWVPGTTIPLIGVTAASHRPGRVKTAAGWNRITISRDTGTTGPEWQIGIHPRRLGTDGHLHDLEPFVFRRPASGPGIPCAESGKEISPDIARDPAGESAGDLPAGEHGRDETGRKAAKKTSGSRKMAEPATRKARRPSQTGRSRTGGERKTTSE